MRKRTGRLRERRASHLDHSRLPTGPGTGEVSGWPSCINLHRPARARTLGHAGLRDVNWQLGRVYFLAFLNPSRGQPDPALTARLASPRYRN